MLIDVHIEIPSGSSVKYEYENNQLRVDRILSTAMVYPGNYGYIPNTLADDGDPIDVLVIETQPLFPTCHIKCKVLGMLVTEDEKGLDQKVIAVPCESIDANSIHMNSILDVGRSKLQLIKDFFTHYKTNEPNKWVKVFDYEDSEATNTLINMKKV